MRYDVLTALILFAFVAGVTPGPNNLMLMASGVNFGLRRTLPHLAGVALGFPAMVALVGFGLDAIFHAFPGFLTALRYRNEYCAGRRDLPRAARQSSHSARRHVDDVRFSRLQHFVERPLRASADRHLVRRDQVPLGERTRPDCQPDELPVGGQSAKRLSGRRPRRMARVRRLRID